MIEPVKKEFLHNYLEILKLGYENTAIRFGMTEENCPYRGRTRLPYLKHYVRGNECYDDIARMAKKIDIENIDSKEEAELLDETLCWLEENVESNLIEFIESCRSKFEELVC